MAELEFYGAAGETTGSMHLLHLPGGCVALDCGLFQGKRMEARQKNLTFPVPPRRLRSVLLSHAHIDHSGNLPGLVRNGFGGRIFATPATCDLCNVMLLDSAKIQEEDARFWNEKRAAAGGEEFIDPLYVAEDARKTQHYFQAIEYQTPFAFGDGSFATFLEAGHILGSACILLEVPVNGHTAKILYTGDLGRQNMPILRDPQTPLPEVDYLITESTYANRRHADAAGMKERLVRIIQQTREAGGKVIVPSFSVGRTQTIVYYLTQAIEEKLLDPLPIYVDSPLSVNATQVFRRHPECYDDEAKEMARHACGLFGEGLVKYITDTEESKRLNDIKDPCVIIASSGMCEAGRILHHLKNNVENEANTVVIVGFQAQHTLGRRIVERREEIRIYGRIYKLLCRVEVLNGFSAHADADDFAKALAPIAPKLKAAFLVHGDSPQLQAMQDIVSAAGCKTVHIPSPGDKFKL
jgi:metallo-beta-lactamase family protein